jgi:hypothetical protein
MKYLLLFALTFANAHAGVLTKPCDELLNKPSTSEAMAVEISHQVAAQIGRKSGYAKLIGAMVGSAALTTYLSAHLDPHFQFVSLFLGQVSTLGVYVFGAPIWEPIVSKSRKVAFGVRTASVDQTDPRLEAIWFQTQGAYSINSQMSRNIVANFILGVQQNFYEAHRAFQSDNRNYAADQIAESAYRLKRLFKEIPPDDPSVAAAIHVAFTNHIGIDRDFVALIWQNIRSIDRDAESQESQWHYQQVLSVWLKVSEANEAM